MSCACGEELASLAQRRPASDALNPLCASEQAPSPQCQCRSDLDRNGQLRATQRMGLRIKKPQLDSRPLKHLRVMPLLMLDKRLAARINRNRHHLRFRLAQRMHDVAVLLTQRMTEDAQALAMTQ